MTNAVPPGAGVKAQAGREAKQRARGEVLCAGRGAEWCTLGAG
ncbi:hypothetical protein [Streptomyces sp. H51]|nr:hypothetical protein [Streptomyces sp. H51]